MNEQQPQRRRARRRIVVYLTADEQECIDRAATVASLGRGPYMRRAALHRAGWHGYSGPMFDRRPSVEDVEGPQQADCLRDALRQLRELAITAKWIYERDEHPSSRTHAMIVLWCRTLAQFEPALPALRRFDDALELALDVEQLGLLIQPYHGLIGKQLLEAAGHVKRALTIKQAGDVSG